MGRRFNKFIAGIVTMAMVATTMVYEKTNVPADNYTAHQIAVGDSFEGNPLKGFVPYNYGSMVFPHSMEWFYIAVNEVQTGMNTFDWSALERKLNDVASRGHQAVMRFYYDYPDVETGVPQFLIDAGLEMKYYNEPNDLGGGGYAPDYENAMFRESMRNFITAFGNEYDGDGRLAYVTLGLLGFWGEWHNWPYDEDTSDGRPDWSISTTVYKEVLDAFDAAFDKTALCVREPKYGINYSGYDIGFHDDSFGYATLSQSNGGQDWSFMQKMKNFNLQNIWETNCIGGEIYPPSQYDIFSGAQPNGNFQSWDKCMDEAHATWMLCDAMRYYTGDMLTKAREAAVGMGYDFQVSTAYYSDVVTSDSLYLSVDIKNIGCAPFYYDHTTWPVEVGVLQGNTLVKSWATQWDLCDIPATGSTVSFTNTVANHGLDDGDYKIAIKVINPIANGNILGFANASQRSDGWLELGQIRIAKGAEETTTEAPTEAPTQAPSEPEISEDITVSFNNTSVMCTAKCDASYENWQMYFNMDANDATGYIVDSKYGFEYMIENGILYYHAANDSNWGWSQVSGASVDYTRNGNQIEVQISRNSFGEIKNGATAQAKFIDNQWNGVYITKVVSVTMSGDVITDDIEINGYQISTSANGMRTVYSFDSNVEGQAVQEVGLIYGIEDDEFDEMYMVADSDKDFVYVSKATKEEGRFDSPISKSESYAMTMTFAAATSEEFTTVFYVRAYAKLQDGRYAYTECHQYTIYDLADYLYSNNLMSNQDKHNYLYNMILKKVDNNYQYKEYKAITSLSK